MRHPVHFSFGFFAESAASSINLVMAQVAHNGPHIVWRFESKATSAGKFVAVRKT